MGIGHSWKPLSRKKVSSREPLPLKYRLLLGDPGFKALTGTGRRVHVNEALRLHERSKNESEAGSESRDEGLSQLRRAFSGSRHSSGFGFDSFDAALRGSRVGRHVEAGPLRFSVVSQWAFYRKFDSDVVGVEGLSQGKNSAHLGWSGSISEDEFWNTHQLTRGDRTTRGPDPHTRTMGGLNCYTMCTSKSKTQHEPHQTSGFCRPRHEPRDGARFGAQSESPPSAEGMAW